MKFSIEWHNPIKQVLLGWSYRSQKILTMNSDFETQEASIWMLKISFLLMSINTGSISLIEKQTTDKPTLKSIKGGK